MAERALYCSRIAGLQKVNHVNMITQNMSGRSEKLPFGYARSQTSIPCVAVTWITIVRRVFLWIFPWLAQPLVGKIPRVKNSYCID